jgi:excisionase family DNA binding protein
MLRTVKHTAQRTGLAEITIRQMIARREIDYVKLRRAVRVSDEEIERLIRESTIPRKLHK